MRWTLRRRSGSADSAVRRSRAGTAAWVAASRVSPTPIRPIRNIVWATCYGDEADALGREDEACAIGEPVAAHARFAAERHQVSLPLDGSSGHRSFRSQHGLLRLPGDFPHHEFRPKLERHQPGPFDAGSEVSDSLLAESLATISGNFTAKWCSRSRRRRFKERVWFGPAPTTRQDLVHQGRGRALERYDQERRNEAMGHHHQHSAVVFRCRNRVYFGRLSLVGQSRAGHL